MRSGNDAGKIATQGSGGYVSKSTLNRAVKQADVRKVWDDYKAAPTEQLRNMLMEHYLHLVRYNAERVHSKLPDEVEIDDLMSAGIFGLMDAIDAFDMA